ncbi:hypothetical protein [Breznakiella homolactica]|uniref:Uncharacterized protein n=1 Tax=Breznakiella homolactica TaxID=2798577 RepID=A0A7T7XM40_9SPIR|nr:hypothetical protein [Breznakiella homolactica]QQO08894.1 hypothetical protein JFL75_18485 [Breznakiella homolactica]
MEKNGSFLEKIPAVLSSRISIFIYLFLFFYLVIFAALCLLIPALSNLAPTDMTQLIMGNYTNVLSALGASIAAGTGASIHSSVKKLHRKHDVLQETIDALHERLDRIERQGRNN